MTDPVIASVKEIWRFPVKSMQGERLDQAELTAAGVVGDRAYALVDRSTGKVISAKSVRLFGGLLGFRAAFVEPPRPGAEPPAVKIMFPDGASVTSDSGDAERLLSTFFRRQVGLARVAPDDFTIDQYHPDVEGADPAGYRDSVVEARLGAALFAQIGAPSPVPPGSFFDVFPVAVLTTSTLTRLGEIQPGSRFDARRFRMNLIVDTEEGGFVENRWFGQAIADYGKAISLDPANYEAYNNMGVAFGNTGRFGMALANFNRAIVLNPDSAVFYINRGRAYMATSLSGPAAGDFRRACAMGNENGCVALRELGF